jgi:4-amino-4-deoxy-L-arabinose transferase-like glycosyltransferase
LCGIAAAFFIFLIGKKLFDNKTGSIAAILFLFSKQFLINSHWARQEMMLTLFIVITIYIYILAKDKESSLLFFLCGLIASLCIDVHLNGIMVPVAIGALFLFTYKIQVFKKFGFWFFIFGAISGVIYWLLMHVFPDTHIFKYLFAWEYINRDSFSTNFPLIPILSGNLFECIIAETERYIKYIRYIWPGEQYLNIFEAILIIIALIFNFRNKNKSILSIIVFTLMGLFCLLVTHKSSFYLIYLYPFFVLSIASFSCYFQRSKNIFKKFVLGSVSLILLISYICQDSYRLWEFKDNNYYKYLDNLKRFIAPGCAIIGPSTWWYGFYEQEYYALLSLDFDYLHLHTNRIDFIRQKQIKYILLDEYWGKNIPFDIKDFLRTNCVLIATLKDKFYGAELFMPNYSSFYALEIYKVKNE